MQAPSSVPAEVPNYGCGDSTTGIVSTVPG